MFTGGKPYDNGTKQKTILQSTLGGVTYYSSFDICSFHQREVQMGGILCGLKIIRHITANQNEYVWYRSLIPGSVTFWYGSGSAIRTLIRRVSDPDPQSAWIRSNLSCNLYADPDPDPGGQK